MDLSRLTYTKGASEQEEKSPVQIATVKKHRNVKSDTSLVVSSSYQKTDGILPGNLIFVLSGGSKRERDFLKILIKHKELHSLRVAFMSKKNQGFQPYQMQSKWKEIREDGKFSIDSQLYHLNTMDKVFLLTDLDEFYDQLVKIISVREDGDDGQWIISNPCIEIWLYYCFKNDPLTDLCCLQTIGTDKRSQKLKKLGNVVIDGGLNPILAFEHLHEGIEHSKQHYSEDENSIPTLFSTQMHKVAQYMVEIMNTHTNEYDEYVKQKAEWREKMKNKTKLEE